MKLIAEADSATCGGDQMPLQPGGLVNETTRGWKLPGRRRPSTPAFPCLLGVKLGHRNDGLIAPGNAEAAPFPAIVVRARLPSTKALRCMSWIRYEARIMPH